MDKQSLEYRILRKSLIAAIVAVSGFLVHDILVQADSLVLIELAGLIFFSICYVVVRKQEKEENIAKLSLLVIFMAYMLLNAAFYVNNGMGIGLAVLYISGITFSHALVHVKYRWYVTAFYSINFAAMMLVEYFYYSTEEVEILSATLNTPIISKAMFISVAIVFTTLVVMYLKKEYSDAYDLLSKNRKKLEEKSRKIEDMNAFLDKKVVERTESLFKEQDKLLKYAFFHSHNVRSPLTNILTIKEALDLPDLEANSKNKLLDELKEQSVKLDNEIKKIQHVIQSENYEERFHDSIQSRNDKK